MRRLAISLICSGVVLLLSLALSHLMGWSFSKVAMTLFAVSFTLLHFLWQGRTRVKFFTSDQPFYGF